MYRTCSGLSVPYSFIRSGILESKKKTKKHILHHGWVTVFGGKFERYDIDRNLV